MLNRNPRRDDPADAALRWPARAAIAVTAVVLLLGFAPVTAAAAATRRIAVPDAPATPAGRAIAALVGDRPVDTLRILPDRFRARTGYTPVVLDGRPAAPHGDCSSPVPLPSRFENACRAHDFGYDLLRYGAATGRPAGDWARPALDAMLVDDMHAACAGDAGCDTAAEAARTALSVNTWRQRFGPPTAETTAEIAVTYLARLTETLGGPL
ncbi:hypothetical protein [Gordonia shandongensis]|uniref:hypothetical protein n=1 Tax=Gordonia shandongensis TaxID=376351 RepID=UPI000425BB48|nr:hypothetical protein [Gordonia shandongensis]